MQNAIVIINTSFSPTQIVTAYSSVAIKNSTEHVQVSLKIHPSLAFQRPGRFGKRNKASLAWCVICIHRAEPRSDRGKKSSRKSPWRASALILAAGSRNTRAGGCIFQRAAHAKARVIRAVRASRRYGDTSREFRIGLQKAARASDRPDARKARARGWRKKKRALAGQSG